MLLSEVAQGGGLFTLAPLVIVFPLLGLLINLIIGRRTSERFTAIVASAAVALAFAVSVLMFVALQSHPEGARQLLADWIVVGDFRVAWSLKIDALAVTMMLMVTGVATLIHIYAGGYMHDDVRFQGDPGRYTRFFIFFNLFVATMMVLVTADNYLVMFVGWEGVGLCSYLLIGFWYEKGKDGIGNAIAGKKAFVVNRIGDFGFMIAMFLVFWFFGTLQFDSVFHQAEELGLAAGGIATGITLFLLLAATGKSAQLPLLVWLPDAMAGPTPVSALIHAATMVTAGIYMLVRNAVLLELAPLTSLIIAIIGAVTGLLAATIAVGQFDIKRVLAYSTISQLGFMIAAVGVGAYVAAMFHLVTHAFFKALLFLAAGSVILGLEHGHHKAEEHHGEHDDEHAEELDPNDMRIMGGLRKKMPITFAVYLIGTLALMGIPPFAGFFSKDEILTDASDSQFGIFLILTTAAFLTALYMGRQIFMVFYGEHRSEPAKHAHENPPIITVPLMLLAFLSLFGGIINVPGLHPLTTYLSRVLEHAHVTEFNFVIAPLAALLAVVAAVIAWLLYGRKPMREGETDPLEKSLGPLFTALNKAWWIDELYDRVIVRPYVWLSTFLAEVIDWRFWHDWFHDSLIAAPFRRFTAWLTEFDLKVIDGAANALANGVVVAAGSLGKLQTGYVRNYALAIFVGAILIIAYILLR